MPLMLLRVRPEQSSQMSATHSHLRSVLIQNQFFKAVHVVHNDLIMLVFFLRWYYRVKTMWHGAALR